MFVYQQNVWLRVEAFKTARLMQTAALPEFEPNGNAQLQ